MKKEYKSEINVNGKTYSLYFDLNVMQSIQKKYGTLEKWGSLTDKTESEIDIDALLFGLTEMINEGIDIENEQNGTNNKFLTQKQVGRIITELGIENVTEKLNQTVIESTKGEEKN